MIQLAINEAKRSKDQEQLDSSMPAGNMVVTTYVYWAPRGKKGYIAVDTTKKVQNGKLVDSKLFYFKSDGDFAAANGSNSAYKKASDQAHEYSKGERNLWNNKADYDKLSDDEREKMRADGTAFWTDDKIRKPR